MKLFYVFLFFLCTATQAKLIDKIVAVINDQTMTMSELIQIRNSLKGRQLISGMIWNKTKMSDEEIIEIFIQTKIIREKLEELGYNITDERVESRIQETEKKSGITRDYLLNLLSNEGLSFEEYYEMIREMDEYNLFLSKIITPLVSITEQEMKNLFFQKSKNTNTLSFIYDLVSFTIPKKYVPKSEFGNFKKALIKYQENGILPEIYRTLETNTIPNIDQDSLSTLVSNALKETPEGNFSDPVYFNNNVTIFYIKKKDVKESNLYQRAKPEIYNMLFIERAQSVTESWLENQKQNYYIHTNL